MAKMGLQSHFGHGIIVVVNKHNTARVASCWFIIFYSIVCTWAYPIQRNL